MGTNKFYIIGGNLIMNLGIIIGLIAVAEFFIAANLFLNYRRSGNPMALCVLLISIGLFVDAFFIAIGGTFDGGLPQGVSRIRFFCHGGLIPLLFPICGYGLKAGKKAMKAVWIFTSVLIVLGIAHALALNLELTEYSGVLRHTMADSTPAWAKAVSSALSFGTVLPLIVSGIVVWIKQKTPYLFLSGILMFVFAALGPAIGRFDLIFFISMFGELFMILFAYLYIRRSESKEKKDLDLAA